MDLTLVGHLVGRTVLYQWQDPEFNFWDFWKSSAYELRYESYQHCFAPDEIRYTNHMAGVDDILQQIATIRLDTLFQKRVEIMSKNEGWVGLLSSVNPYHSSTLWRWLQGDTVPWWKEIWECMVQPTEAVLSAAAPYMPFFKENDVVGLQIRMVNKAWSEDNTRQEWPYMSKIVDAFLFCSNAFPVTHGKKRRFFLLSDLEDVHTTMRNKVGAANMLSVDGSIIHVDRAGGDRATGLQRMAVELYLLGETVGNVLGRTSNFGRIGTLRNPTLPLGLDFLSDIGPDRPIDEQCCVQLNGRDVIRKSYWGYSDPSRIKGILELENPNVHKEWAARIAANGGG